MRTIQAMCVLAVGVLLASCGGGNSTCYGGPGSTLCSPPSGIGTATALTIKLNKPSVANTGDETVTATVTASATGGETVRGVPVSFTVDNGATFTPLATETGAEGIVMANINIGPNRANRTITVVATTGSLPPANTSFLVTGATLSATPIPAVVQPRATASVEYALKDAAGGNMVGQDIRVEASTAGIADGKTDSNGRFTFRYTAPATPGTLRITAKAGGVEKILDVPVQETSTVPPAGADPESAKASADPSVIAPNVDTSTNYLSVVSARFRDVNDKPIKNMRVRYSVNNDYGAFTAGLVPVYSDAEGVALTSFIPGTRTSPTEGVVVTVCYARTDFATCPAAGVASMTTTLTIASSPLSITIGTDLTIVISDLTYKQRFVVTAVDIAGRPKANVEITPSVDLQYYYKGIFSYVGSVWTNAPCVDPKETSPNCTQLKRAPYPCRNEDKARTGYYQKEQDLNQNGQIDPSKADVLISTVGSTKTDANGLVTLQIEYPKNLAYWVYYQILVTAGVAGTEGRKTWTALLLGPISAIKAEATPPFYRSPYGDVTEIAKPSINFPPPAVPRGPVPPCENAD